MKKRMKKKAAAQAKDMVTDTLKDMAMALPNAIQAGFQQMAQALVAPLREAIAGIGKDMASGMSAAVGQALDPRKQLRDIAGKLGEAGKPLDDEQMGQMFQTLKGMASGKAQGVFAANRAAGGLEGLAQDYRSSAIDWWYSGDGKRIDTESNNNRQLNQNRMVQTSGE